MNTVARFVSWLALALTVVPAALFALSLVGDGAMKIAMMVGTVLWFGAAPYWLKGGGE
jgi:hypothetical protein